MDTDTIVPLGFRRNAFGERYLPDLHRRLFESEPAAEVFARQLADDLDAENTLFVVIGSDSGLLLDHLARLPLGRGSHRLVIEIEEIHALIAARTAHDAEGVTLCAQSGWEEALERCGPSRYLHGGRIRLVESLGCQHDHTGLYQPVLQRVRKALGDLTHRHAIDVGGKTFTLKQIVNACENVHPASLLEGIGAGRTAMVLGGGPSLDESIGWIETHRDSLFLIVASRLCGRLRRLDIRPDVVVAVDPQPAMYDLSREGMHWTDVPLVGSFHLAPQLAHQWRGPYLYLGERYPWDEPSDGGGGNIACKGPTVSHAAAWLAHAWGFERILLSGVDMCHAVGGGSHAHGNVERVLDSLPGNYSASVRTYGGLVAGTPKALQHGLECLEDVGKTINAVGPVLFNTSVNAARVDSIPLVALAELAPSGPRPRVELTDDPSRRAAHLRSVHREQAEAVRRFGAIGRRCREAKGLLDGMDGARDERAFGTRRRKLERLEKGLGKDHGPWFDVLRRYASAELLASVKPSGFDDETSGRQDWGRTYYRIIERTAKTLSGVLSECDTRTSMRLAELEDEPDIDALLAYWATDGTPGRVLGLRERLASTSTVAAERLDAAADTFFATLEEKESAHLKPQLEGLMLPGSILRNLLFLFREEMQTELSRMADSLRTVSSPHDVFADCASGLRAELEGDTDAALDAYQNVIDRFGEWHEREEGVPTDFGILLEDTLQRIVQCYLQRGDGAAAVGALSLLSHLSPMYTSRYAHLLHLLGRDGEALETLENHVRNEPDDWRALLQMADIFAAIGAEEAAAAARALAVQTREGGGALDTAA